MSEPSGAAEATATLDWTRAGAHLVAPGVHRIPLPLPNDALRAVNVYVLESREGLVLVDGGWALASARAQLQESLRSIGAHPRDITSFLVTHAHRDHYTQAVSLRTEFGRARVSLGRGDEANVRRGTRVDVEEPFLARVRAAGDPHLARAWELLPRNARRPELWGPPDTWLEGDQQLQVGERTLHAVPTPGHTAGHFVFVDRDAGLMFSGDHVLPDITPSIGFEPVPADQPLASYLASLAKVRAMPDLALLPAHGATATRSHERVDALLAHHRVRLGQCLAAVLAGYETASAVARELSWTRRGRSLGELGTFNAALAVMETMAHLDLLWARGDLGKDVEDGVARYTRAGAGCTRNGMDSSPRTR